MRSPQSGFTLIEIMVALVIVAILAAIAIPSYQDYVTKSRRTAAKTTLMDMVSKQENYFSDFKQYADKISKLGYPADIIYLDSNANVSSSQNSESTYKITMVQSDTFDFAFIAQAVQMQAKDSECLSYKVDHQGARTATNASCW